MGVPRAFLEIFTAKAQRGAEKKSYWLFVKSYWGRE
jgi:hypothetical protein